MRLLVSGVLWGCGWYFEDLQEATVSEWAWSIGLGICSNGRSMWKDPWRCCVFLPHFQSLWKWRGRRCEDKGSKGHPRKEHCARAAWCTEGWHVAFVMENAITTHQLFSQAICLSVVAVFSRLACPAEVCHHPESITLGFPALSWESQ